MLGVEHPEASWVQVNLAPQPRSCPRLYEWLAGTAHDLLDEHTARAFFFMHKPPGLRVRFQASRSAGTVLLQAELLDRIKEFGRLAGPPVCAVYEPESYLFGGPGSMPWVHDVFTADSLAWLDHHTRRPGDGGGHAAADWRLSLALLREMFDGLGIVGWEHRGVWDAVRTDTGRRLPEGLRDTALRRAARGIRAYWEQPRGQLLTGLPETWRVGQERHCEAVHLAAARWRTGYFESGYAQRGPRRAAAHVVIFHWNRARLSHARQSLLAEALFDDGADDGAVG
ncbi:thiopeptide-type bacteriocin biosynthesis protein [Streptomyces sp. NBC_00825]|uniref:thiopeptide-type bacteriocin biosynthesis protein n=1 Tax=unclassified Streptomyces TaxID=2593676 RepID=UPI002ED332A1|nr:thiopeptide-type bacteriocin biosynthesis protein [Streptomyces sp. NBC_00826]WTH92670.1 thiopeptide-type bacteriocin biosynthesis protein [Streptomyces sp. NBC_00825]WTI01401.1 thiopeptide-type bacteriocin biosynthesis protein [Streptomyces sp. NBC_00822]